MKRFFRIEPKISRVQFSNEISSKVMTNVSQIDDDSKNVCLIEESPYYIHRVRFFTLSKKQQKKC